MDIFETGLTSAGLMTAVLILYKLSQSANWSSSCRSRLVDEVEEKVKERVREEINKIITESHGTAPRMRGESKTDETM